MSETLSHKITMLTSRSPGPSTVYTGCGGAGVLAVPRRRRLETGRTPNPLAYFEHKQVLPAGTHPAGSSVHCRRQEAERKQMIRGL